MMQWFPVFALKQIRRYVNFATLLVENLSPSDNSDIELSADNRVLTWIFFNHQSKEKILLNTLNVLTKGAVLNKIVQV